MALIHLRDVQLSYGGPALLAQATLNIEAGERCCLVGRNGTGKSTLMKLIAGEIQADSGHVQFQAGVKVARLMQEVPVSEALSVYQVIAQGLGEVGQWLAEYDALSQQLGEQSNDALIERLSDVQHNIEECDGWSLNQNVLSILNKMHLAGETDFAALSGGVKRRVMLAQALVSAPNVLLLDEPTNHLDIASIDWLEDFLLGYNGTLLFVTHDRAFLQRLATRIVELDRGKLSSWDCDYSTYLQRKAASMEAQAHQDAVFDKKLAQEEVWIRQGIKARRTRNEGRVRALEKMREDYSARRRQIGKAKITIDDAKRSGKLVIEAQNIHFSYDAKPLVRDFSTVILRGDKIGVIGPNGVGKTTLIQILLGRLAADAGQVELGEQLQVAYFDQLRAQLDEESSVLDNLAHGSQQIELNGRSRHVISYLQDFLFAPERAQSPVKSLSGGERNRLLLAKLFAKPSNFLVLDEPTNDLDVETLELLEDRLMEYTGTLLIVSHDRVFLNNVVTGCFAFEGDGVVNAYVGGYDDWVRQRKSAPTDAPQSGKTKTPEKNAVTRAKQKLSFSEQHELHDLPKRIEALEATQGQLQAQVAEADFYQQDAAKTHAVNRDLQAVQTQLKTAYERWEALEASIG